MQLKLDENLGERGRLALLAAGHDVCTVAEQNLRGALDVELIEQCRLDRRALVTLDMDFSNPLRYPPIRHAGVAVLRMPGKPGSNDLELLVRTLIRALAQNNLSGKLWIVEPARIRVYQDAT